MAIADPEALEYVEALAGTPLAWLARSILERIDALPALPRETAQQRVEDADRQLDEIREAALWTVKREIDWTDALEELRSHFGLERVAVELPMGGTAALTGDGRRGSLDRFAATLARELEESRSAVRRREGTDG